MAIAAEMVLDGFDEVPAVEPVRKSDAQVKAEAGFEDMLHTWGFVQNPPMVSRGAGSVLDAFYAKRYYDYKEAQERRIAILLGYYKPRTMLQSIEAQADAERSAEIADLVERAWRLIPDYDSRQLLKVMYVDRTAGNAARARLRCRKVSHLHVKLWRAKNYLKRNIDFIKKS